MKPQNDDTFEYILKRIKTARLIYSYFSEDIEGFENDKSILPMIKDKAILSLNAINHTLHALEDFVRDEIKERTEND